MLKNSEYEFGLVAKFFHWLMALAIIGMLILGLYMVGLGTTPNKFKLYGIHKSVGATILAFAVLRLLWRAMNLIPKMPEHMPKWEKIGADLSHYALYVCMLFMPLSGWLMSSAAGFPVSVFGWFKLPDLIQPNADMRKLFGTAHFYIAYTLIGLICLHVLAALKHHFIDKDNILKRMLP